MLTVPGIKTLRARNKKTKVLCQCGETLFCLSESQSLHVQASFSVGQLNSKEGACLVCGEKYTIPIQNRR
jgi:hypothetical protein